MNQKLTTLRGRLETMARYGTRSHRSGEVQETWRLRLQARRVSCSFPFALDVVRSSRVLAGGLTRFSHSVPV